MSDNKNCTTCTYKYTCNWELAGDNLCCENWEKEAAEPITFLKKDVLDIILRLSGRDGSDEYARGWDAACDAILVALRDWRQ